MAHRVLHLNPWGRKEDDRSPDSAPAPAAVSFEDEQRVITHLARWLLEGQRRYGRLRLEADPRDFKRERAEEIADLLMDSAFAELKRVVR